MNVERPTHLTLELRASGVSFPAASVLRLAGHSTSSTFPAPATLSLHLHETELALDG